MYVFVSQNTFTGTNPKQAPMFVLLGNPVYGRWFLDGSDPDVRLVGRYTYPVCSINVKVSSSVKKSTFFEIFNF